MPLPFAIPAATTSAPLLQFAGRGVQAAGALAILERVLGLATGAARSAAASPGQALQAGNTTAGKYTVSPSNEASVYTSALYNNAFDTLLQLAQLSDGSSRIDPEALIANAREKNLAALRETRAGEIALGELDVMQATNPAIAQGAATTVTSADDLLGQVMESILSNARVGADAAVGQVI